MAEGDITSEGAKNMELAIVQRAYVQKESPEKLAAFISESCKKAISKN